MATKLTREERKAIQAQEALEAAAAAAKLFENLNNNVASVVDDMLDDTLNSTQPDETTQSESKPVEVKEEPPVEELPAETSEEVEEAVVEEPKEVTKTKKAAAPKPVKEKTQEDSFSALNIKQKKKGAPRNMYLEADINEAIERICKETGAGVSATVNALLKYAISVYNQSK